jgi:uncharacterized protein (DUF2345 family)
VNVKREAVVPPPPSTVRKGPPRRISEKTFLDVVVMDTDGKPLAGRAYKLQLPDGRTRTGNLGADGRLQETNIDPGTGLLTLLPDKGEAIEASPPPANESLSFVEIVLRDDSGDPVGGQRYEIELPDGTKQTGVTDEKGVAVLHQIPRGDCNVTFPDLDEGVWSQAEEAASA